MTGRRTATQAKPVLWRIGEVAKLTGVTTRALRYWEELGLLRPTSRTDGGERLYTPTDLRRVTRIRDLQELLGFSLEEVKAVLTTGDVDVLDRVHHELRDGEVSLARRRELLDEAIAANDQLVSRLDDTLARISALREERAAIAIQLRETRDQLGPDTSPLRTHVSGIAFAIMS
jgi:MerR family transcriptional regulator, repressor of the yfmOP operon